MESVPELPDLPVIFISSYGCETIASPPAPAEAADPPDTSQACRPLYYI